LRISLKPSGTRLPCAWLGRNVHKKLLGAGGRLQSGAAAALVLGAGTPKGLQDRVAALFLQFLRILLAYPTINGAGDVSDKRTLSHRDFETRRLGLSVSEKGRFRHRLLGNRDIRGRMVIRNARIFEAHDRQIVAILLIACRAAITQDIRVPLRTDELLTFM